MIKAVKITTQGEMTPFDLSTNELEQLQAAVGGYIQAVNLSDDITLWCNEEGKIMNLPHNPIAQVLWDKFFGANTDLIVGDVVITGGADDEGKTVGLSSENELLLIVDIAMAAFKRIDALGDLEKISALLADADAAVEAAQRLAAARLN